MNITWENIRYYLDIAQNNAKIAYDYFFSLHPYLQIIIGFVFFSVLVRFLFKKTKHKHQRNINKSKRMIGKVSRIKDPNKQVVYLRKIDHFLFEEVVLSALSSMGLKIKRNAAYTGDGGIDGQVKIKGKWYLIQSKRYSNYIDKTHVEEFVNVCRKRKQPGLFIHTGKTGKETALVFQSTRNIHCVSGHLLSLMFDKKKKKYWMDYVEHHKI